MSWGRTQSEETELELLGLRWQLDDMGKLINTLKSEIDNLKAQLALHKSHIKALEAGLEEV